MTELLRFKRDEVVKFERFGEIFEARVSGDQAVDPENGSVELDYDEWQNARTPNHHFISSSWPARLLTRVP